jgi:hypothetical protein
LRKDIETPHQSAPDPKTRQAPIGELYSMSPFKNIILWRSIILRRWILPSKPREAPGPDLGLLEFFRVVIFSFGSKAI